MEYLDHTHHVMWQPTANCSCRCAGCYVPQMKQDEIDIEIAKKVFSTREIICTQFTLSADNLTQFPKELKDCVRGIWKHYPKHMKQTINGIEIEVTGLPELCVTANSWNTVLCWARDLDMTVDQFLQPVSILSLSTFPALGKNIAEVIDQCHSCGTKVNYNYMVKGGEKDSKSFEMGCRYADHVYLVLKKAPLGQEQDPQDYYNWLAARDIAKREAENKLDVDACVLDVIHYIHTGHPCGAGRTKKHVWPNGVTTGCPYDSNQTCGGMEKCKIFDVVNGVRKKSLSSCNLATAEYSG